MLRRSYSGDPLAGAREAINNGELERLLWPVEGDTAPVKEGQLFKLRTCYVEITKVHQVTPKDGGPKWRAEFVRHYSDKRPYLLGRRGYTHDPKSAMRAQDSRSPETLDTIDPEDRSEAHRGLGEPPEPEGPLPGEVAHLGRVSRTRYKREIGQAQVLLDAQPLSVRLKRLEQLADDGADVTRFLSAIENRIKAGERRAGVRKAA